MTESNHNLLEPIQPPTWVERSKKEDIDYHTQRYTIHNDILLLGYDNMTITEKKIIRLIIANVQKNPSRSEFPIYQTTITELADVLETTPKCLYNEINRISNDLMDRKLYIRYENKPDKWEKYHWVGWTGYDNGVFSIKLSEEIKNFFLDLRGNFTIFEHLDYIMGYRCSYTVDISEALAALIKRDPIKRSQFSSGNTIKVEIDMIRFREITSTQNKYKALYDLRKRVLHPAIKEMNDLSDLFIENVEFERRGGSKKVNNIVFYLHDKVNRSRNESHKKIENVFVDETSECYVRKIDADFIKEQLNIIGVSFKQDQVNQLLKYYQSTSEFTEDLTTASQYADHDIVRYLLAMAKNKEKTVNKAKTINHEWDTLELKDEFIEILDYWNDQALKQEVEFGIAGVTEGYALKKVLRKDRRVRENYFKLKEEGETKESVIRAIDVAATSQFFLRISGTFSFFINPKNYYDIAAGERDYDTDQANLWKMGR